MKLTLFALAIATFSTAGCGSPPRPAPQCAPLQCEEWSCKYDSSGSARVCECMD